MSAYSKSRLATACAVALACSPPLAVQGASLMWLNHLEMLPGDPTVMTDFNAVSAMGTLSGLMITSSTTGEDAPGGGNKVVEKGVTIPPTMTVNGVRVCYEVFNPDDPDNAAAPTYISQIRLAQLQDPPDTALVRLDDGTDLLNPGPLCVDSAPPFGEPIDPAAGGLRLALRVNFGDTADTIVVRGVALYVDLLAAIDIKPFSDPNSINTKKKGVVPVAVCNGGNIRNQVDIVDDTVPWGYANATTNIDVTTLRFGPDGAAPKHDLTDPAVLGEHMTRFIDTGDRFGEGAEPDTLVVLDAPDCQGGATGPDLAVHFPQRDTGLAKGDTEACVEGDLAGGAAFSACSDVNIVK